MIPTYIISVLIGFVILAAFSAIVWTIYDHAIDGLRRYVARKRPHSPKPQSPRKGLSEGDGVTVSHFGGKSK